MEDHLIAKLNTLLLNGITDETHVVYFLVEARKLMDRNKRYYEQTLRMFANWACHITLAKDDYAPLDEMLAAFESEYVEWINGRGWKPTQWERLTTLREALGRFLEQASLPTKTATDDHAWLLFATNYSEVVLDCPVTLVSKSLQHIKALTLGRAGLQIAIGDMTLVGLNWNITLHNGKGLVRSVMIE